LIGRYALKSNTNVTYSTENVMNPQEYLDKIIGANNSNATMNVPDDQYVVSSNTYYPGFNYQVGDVLTISNDINSSCYYPAKITVLAVTPFSVGTAPFKISSYALSNVGHYVTFPTNPVSVTGGHGQSAQFWLYPDYIYSSSNTLSISNVPSANYISFGNSFSLITSNGFQMSSEIADVDFSSGTIYMQDSVWVRYSNVAYAIGSNTSNVINIANVYTSVYNLYNNGVYSNPKYPLIDIIQTGDHISQNGYHIGMVNYLDWANNQVYLYSNSQISFSSNVAVKKVPSAQANKILFSGTNQIQYTPYIIDEAGEEIITEDGNNIILG